MKKSNFTIVELLVVIAIIMILAGLLFPAVSKVKERAKIVKAKAEMTSIVTAIKAYESTYGYLPLFGKTALGAAATVDTTARDNYRTLIEYLTCTPGPANGTNNYNYRKIRFLDVPANYGTSTGTVNGTKTGAVKGDYQDPWGNLYQIYLDSNYDGKVDSSDVTVGIVVGSSGAVGGASGTATLNGSIFIYSLGPKGVNDYGKNAQFGEKPASGDPYDDVCQWR